MKSWQIPIYLSENELLADSDISHKYYICQKTKNWQIPIHLSENKKLADFDISYKYYICRTTKDWQVTWNIWSRKSACITQLWVDCREQ